MRNIKKLTLTLVALFAMTAGAWADGTVTVTELKASDITAWSGDNKALTAADLPGFVEATAEQAQSWDGYPTEGMVYLIYGFDNGKMKKITYTYGGAGTPGQVDKTRGSVHYDINVGDRYFYVTGITGGAPAGTALTPDATRKVWTLDAMPAGNVELQVAYYPGMLVKPTSLVGGTMEIEGVTATTLPAGFEKDDAGNIYVEAGKTFKVKAVPAEGYQLVGWSDDATIKDLEREFTMPDDGSDFTVTATFSDEFELTFDDVNFKTNQNITVKVGDADKTLDQDGKLSVKAGQTVTLTAKQGYKFRSVEAKKAAPALLSLQVCGETIYYAEGETWGDAIKNHPTENAGWNLDGDGYVNHDNFGYLLVSDDFVPGNTPIDPNASYDCTGI